MSGYLMEHLIENYQYKWIFILNNKEVKMGLKNVALISIMKIVKTEFKPTEAWNPLFRDRYFLGIEKVTYQETNQSVFGSRFIRDVKLEDER